MQIFKSKAAVDDLPIFLSLLWIVSKALRLKVVRPERWMH